jgi:hypothetical protein
VGETDVDELGDAARKENERIFAGCKRFGLGAPMERSTRKLVSRQQASATQARMSRCLSQLHKTLGSCTIYRVVIWFNGGKRGS